MPSPNACARLSKPLQPPTKVTARTAKETSAQLRKRLILLLNEFDRKSSEDDLREKVKALVPAMHALRKLGSSMVPHDVAQSAQDRILFYLRQYPYTVIAGDELAVVSGISDYPRRIRELRKEFGWPIYSGVTVSEMMENEEQDLTSLLGKRGGGLDAGTLRVNDYLLIGEQDREAAYRWNTANTIRRLDLSVKDKVLRFLRENVGRPVTGEELRYVSNDKKDWSRRTRELRTEEGWPVTTRSSGRPDLNIGVYVLEADRQALPHDRRIKDHVRAAVLQRDSFRCRRCGWNPADSIPGDPRHMLELHHVIHHVEGGDNAERNLITLCNVHHDEVHRLKLSGVDDLSAWLGEAIV